MRRVVGVKRAELEDMYKEMRGAWALELYGLAIWEAVNRDQEPLEIYGEYIWTKMFPRVPYDVIRFNVIRETAKAKVEGILKDYDMQWQRWVTAPMMPQYHQAEALWAMGTLAVVPKNRVFRPRLNFDLD